MNGDLGKNWVHRRFTRVRGAYDRRTVITYVQSKMSVRHLSVLSVVLTAFAVLESRAAVDDATFIIDAVNSDPDRTWTVR